MEVRSTRRQRGDADAVVTAAARAFAEKGYTGTSLQDLAASVGLLKGSLYYYIDSKEQLLHRVVQRFHDAVAANAAMLADSTSSARVRLERFVDGHVRAVVANREAAIVWLTSASFLNAEARRDIEATRSAYEGRLAILLTEASARGEVRSPVTPSVQASTILASLDACCLWYEPQQMYSIETVVESYVHLVLDGIATAVESTDPAAETAVQARPRRATGPSTAAAGNDRLESLLPRMRQFIDDVVVPAEPALSQRGPHGEYLLRELQRDATERGLWALGLPAELGGGGLVLTDYLPLCELQGRSDFGSLCVGGASLADTVILDRHATAECRKHYLDQIVAGTAYPSLAVAEPGVMTSDPGDSTTTAELVGDEWVVNGRKSFATFGNRATFTMVMCKTEADERADRAYSLVVVPMNAPGCRFVRETPTLGLRGDHTEMTFENVRIPSVNLLGRRGGGYQIVTERLTLSRLVNVAMWIGQADKAFELMRAQLLARQTSGPGRTVPAGWERAIFDSHAEIHACRLMAADAASKLDRGEPVMTEVSTLKVIGAQVVHRVVDRAIQVFGPIGLTEDTPLSRMYRQARSARVYEGPDEVHVEAVARRVLHGQRPVQGRDRPGVPA